MSQYVHDQWGPDRGFLGGAVHAICQSQDGYLWIGTERGLVRFDGFRFMLIQRPIPTEPAIGPVRGFVADSEGNLWIRPDGPHLLRYREGAFEDAVRRFKLQEIAFTAMARSSHGDLLLWGLQNGTLTYRKGQFERLITPATPGTVISLTETSDQSLWMGTRDSGLFRFRRGALVSLSEQPNSSSVNTLLPAKDGGVWIGTEGGINFWNGTKLIQRTLPSAIGKLEILALIEDHEGNLWIGADRGLIRITPATPRSSDSLNHTANEEITAVYEADDGSIWYGGLRGIERLRDGMFTTYSTAQSLPSENNGPVYADSGGRTWFAPLSGGLYWLTSRQVGHVTNAGLDKDVIYSIGGGGGLYRVWETKGRV